jgi:threonylcarbamoyladenosine tRNA methylthiotransferase MtaB
MKPVKHSPEIITFGCRLNAYESEVIREQATAAGTEDIVVVNTCAVTKEAERQARQAIRRIRRRRPEAQIVVTGCAAQIDPTIYAAMPEVDRVIGNSEKLDAASYRSDVPVLVNDIMSVRETANHLIRGFEDRARAFVQVQQGCDHRCTFCIIPYGRGNSRSVPIGEITRQVSALVDNGYHEIVLSGVDISSYGGDLPGQPSLGQMTRRLLANVPRLRRLRISSIDCIEIDDHLKRLIADEERLMPHLHLSLQAGDDMILKRMKRRHTRAQAVALCEELRSLRPDVVFGADVIVGFPTETEAMFQKTMNLVADCGLTWLHVFPYSERPGTPASRMPSVEIAERKSRATRLRALGDAAAHRYLNSRVGLTEEILLETQTKGHAASFAPVEIGQPGTPGDIVAVRIDRVDESGNLQATPIAQRAS